MCESPKLELATCTTATNYPIQRLMSPPEVFCMLCFYICPDSHIITLYKYPTVTAPHRQVWTDWTGVGVSPLPCTGSLLTRFSMPSAPCWGLQNLQYALEPACGNMATFSIAFNSYPFPCDKLSQTLLNYHTVCWDLSALHCGCLCPQRCGAETGSRHPADLLGLPSPGDLTTLETAPWFKSTSRCPWRVQGPAEQPEEPHQRQRVLGRTLSICPGL